MQNTVILFSSADQQGNTYKLLRQVQTQLDEGKVKVIELDKLTYQDYNYANDYPYDDFYAIAETLDWAQNIIFASPNYWHSVTSNMKRFIDRMTELTENPQVKPIGKGLKNKRGFVITTSSQPQMCPILEGFFVKLFDYFDMDNASILHANCRDGFTYNEQDLNKFVQLLRT